MRISTEERKQIENEMIFRRINEKVGADLDIMDKIHRDDGDLDLLHDDIILLHFKCECSDENCSVRIPLKLSEYRKVHVNRNAFIVKINHQVDKIEKVIKQEDGYNIVQKKNSTKEPSDILNNTSIDNSQNN